MPTHARWLNQIECWFNILYTAVLRKTSFTSPRQERQAVDAIVETYNLPLNGPRLMFIPAGSNHTRIYVSEN
jgi:hypothetical protein